jgi:TM2 domain-containing membrane protein YozV
MIGLISLGDSGRTVTKVGQLLFLLSIFLGFLAADRFYVGHGDLGVLKLVTVGGFMIWWLVDIILLFVGRMKDGRRTRNVFAKDAVLSQFWNFAKSSRPQPERCACNPVKIKRRSLHSIVSAATTA